MTPRRGVRSVSLIGAALLLGSVTLAQAATVRLPGHPATGARHRAVVDQTLPPCVPAEPIPSASPGASDAPIEPDLPTPPPPTGTPWMITLTGSGAACELDGVVRFGSGFAATRDATVLLSPDGRWWPPIGSPVPGARRLVPRSPLLVEFKGSLYAFGARRGGMQAWRLGPDGRFVELSLPQVRSEDGRTDSADAVAATSEGLVLVGGVRTARFDRSCESTGPCADSSFVWTTVDGDAWQVDRASDRAGATLFARDRRPDQLFRIWPTATGYAALGGFNRVLTSDDGIRWSVEGSLPPEIQVIAGMGYRADEAATYAVVRAAAGVGDGTIPEGTAVVLRSLDLVDWVVAYELPWPRWRVTTADVTEEGIAFGGYADGWFPWMVLSDDGMTWDLSVGWPGNEHGSVDAMAVGADGTAVAIGGVAAAEGPLAWFHPASR